MAQDSRDAKKQRRIPKDLRRNMKGWAEGLRETILKPHIEGYADARVRGWKSERDYIEKVCDEYHARIDWRLLDDKEPQAPLAPYNPNERPQEELLSPDEAAKKKARVKQLNGRIKRWLLYRVRTLQNQYMGKLDPRKNPYYTLMAKLSGIHAPPKARQAYQQFMKERYHEEIDPWIKKRWAEHVKQENLPADALPGADFRSKVSRDVFKKLPPERQIKFSERAKAAAQAAKDQYEKDMNSPVSRRPRDIQRCIDNLPKFLQPILTGLQERTGLKFFIMYGGPVPRNDGEITACHLNYGFNNDQVPFSKYDQEVFNNVMCTSWRAFLDSCYTDSDKQLVALNPNDDEGPVPSDSEDSGSESSSDSGSDDEEDHRQLISSRKRQRQPSTASSTRRPTKHVNSSATTPFEACFAHLDKGKSVESATAKVDKRSSYGGHPGHRSRVEKRLPSAHVRQLKRASVAAPKPRSPTPESSSRVENSMQNPSPASLPTTTASTSVPSPPSEQPTLSTSGTMPASHTLPQDASLTGSGSNDSVPMTSIANSPVIPTDIAVSMETAMDLDQPAVTADTSAVPPEQPAAPMSTTLQEAPSSLPSPTTPSSQPPPPPLQPLPASLTPQVSQLSSTPLADTLSTPLDPSTNSPSAPTALTTTASSPSAPGSTSAPAVKPTCPTSAHEWFKKAFDSIDSQHLHPAFNVILHSFCAIEASYGYQNPSKGLPAGKRPLELNRWIGGGRWRGKAPTVTDPARFSGAWWAWWSSLQPGWRERNLSGRPTIGTYGEDWASLRYPGQNGVLSVIATLSWWGNATASAPAHGPGSQADWLDAVNDVAWMLQGLAATLG